MRFVLLLCVVLVVWLSACTASTSRSLDTPSIPLTFISSLETPEPEYPLPFYDISPPDGSEITWLVYKEWLRNTSTGPIRVVIAPDNVNPLIANGNGTIIYENPLLFLDGKSIEMEPIMQDFLGLTCQGTKEELATFDVTNCMGTGPFQYNYAPDLAIGLHEAKARWEAHDGQIYEYSWSFTLTE